MAQIDKNNHISINLQHYIKLLENNYQGFIKYIFIFHLEVYTVYLPKQLYMPDG